MNRGSGISQTRCQLGTALLVVGIFTSLEAHADQLPTPATGGYGPPGGNSGYGGNIGQPGVFANTPQEGFHPRIDLAEVYVDNIDLAPPGEPKTTAFLTQVRPGIQYARSRPRFQAVVEYQYQYLLNANDTSRNQSYHSLDAFANGAVIPDLFFVKAAAGGSQIVANTTQASSLDTVVNGTGNLVNGYTGSITPYLEKRLGSTLAHLEYSYGFVSYRGAKNGGFSAVNISGSRNQRILATWGSEDTKDQPLFSWNTSFDRQQASYGGAIPDFRYEQALATLGYGATRSLRLLAEVGAESTGGSGGNGGTPNNAYYQGGFSYLLGHTGEIRALAGHRFYGTSYDFLYRYLGRILGVELTYAEGPTTAAQELFIRPATGVGPTVVTPVITGGDLSSLVNEVFVRKYFDGRVSLKGRRTEIDLTLNVYRRNYLTDAVKNDRLTQVAVSGVRVLNSRDRLRLTYALRRHTEQIAGSGGDLNESMVRLELVRQLSPTLSVTAAAGNLRGTGSTSRYIANYGLINIGKTF